MPEQQPQFPQPPVTLTVQGQPGIQRDGTPFCSQRWTDGQWVRFQRGKPKKMGGYRAMTNVATGPIRKILIDARVGTYTAHTFSPWGIERIAFDPSTGAGGGVSIRTPSGLSIPNTNYNWSADKLISSGGSTCTLAALAAADLADITNDTAGTLYSGDITQTTALTTVYSDVAGTIPLQVSGDVVALPPFLFVCGSNGLIQNSNPNNIVGPSYGWTNASSGSNVYANVAYVAGTKFVKGLPLRGGSLSPAGLFWALDALVRVSFQGSSGGGYFNYWRYDTISGRMSVLSKNGIIEYDGNYFWVGVDRFFVYNGNIQELPNDTNLNYFFDNLNVSQRQKVFAVKVPRYGEIWWFFPKGQGQVECNAAVIYNVRENEWYDCQLMRTTGQEADIFPSPILCGGENSQTAQHVPYTATSSAQFVVNDVVTGSTSHAKGTVIRITTEPALDLASVTGIFQNSETITGSVSGATGTTAASGVYPANSQEVDVIWQHEVGTDKVLLQTQTPINSYITTPYFSYAGGMGQQAPQGVNLNTRLLRVEPDFTSLGSLGRTTGTMSVTVNGQSYPNLPSTASTAYLFDSTVGFVDTREQRREMTLTFTSNTFGGYYEMGRILVTMEPGDGRG